MDDELLRFCRSLARDPDGGDGSCLSQPGPAEPGEVPALRLDHIAVVVRELERAVELFELLGYAALEPRRMAGNLSVLMKSGALSVALFVPISRHSDLQPFLAARGAGVQHMAFETVSLDQTAAVLGRVLDWEQKPYVFPELRMLWSKPDPVTGLVIELFERRGKAEDGGEPSS